MPAELAAADDVAAAAVATATAAAVVVPTVAAVIVPAVELRRQSVGLESGRVELAQGHLTSIRWVLLSL